MKEQVLFLHGFALPTKVMSKKHSRPVPVRGANRMLEDLGNYTDLPVNCLVRLQLSTVLAHCRDTIGACSKCGSVQ